MIQAFKRTRGKVSSMIFIVEFPSKSWDKLPKKDMKKIIHHEMSKLKQRAYDELDKRNDG